MRRWGIKGAKSTTPDVPCLSIRTASVALCIGLLAGTISTAGFARLQPLLAEAVDLQDTCGVNNLHGMPGVLGGLLSALAALAIPPSAYGGNIHAIVSERTKPTRTTQWMDRSID